MAEAERARCELCGNDNLPLVRYWTITGANGEKVPGSDTRAHASCVADRFFRVEWADGNAKGARKHLKVHNLTDGKSEYLPKPISQV